MAATDYLPLELIEKLLAQALAGGGDFAEIYLEHTRANTINVEEHHIRAATHGVTLGVGVRVIAGTEVGYAFSDDLDFAALVKTASVAAAIARGGGAVAPVRVTPREIPDRYPVPVLLDEIAASRKAELLLRAQDTAYAHDARVTQVMGVFADSTRELLIANSDGEYVEDCQSLCRLSLNVVATDGAERRTGFSGGGGRVGFTHFETFTPEHIGHEAARMATAQLGAVDAPAGPQTVVLSPGWSGILLHEAVGHGLEADFIAKGSSLYAGKLGQRVASPLCTVIDSGTISHKRGTLNVDDEGVVAEEKVLIEGGILRGYMVDRLSAKRMGLRATGSGRRESYRHAPMPRMTNTYMAAGPHAPEEIVKSVKRGIYCAAFGGGQVDISNGNFVFEVRESYLIEDGVITRPVKNATLIGVGPEALKNVSMVGNDPALDPGIGTCGKDGQSVPVGVGLPTVRIDNMTVGGTNAAS